MNGAPASWSACAAAPLSSRSPILSNRLNGETERCRKSKAAFYASVRRNIRTRSARPNSGAEARALQDLAEFFNPFPTRCGADESTTPVPSKKNTHGSRPMSIPNQTRQNTDITKTVLIRPFDQSGSIDSWQYQQNTLPTTNLCKTTPPPSL